MFDFPPLTVLFSYERNYGATACMQRTYWCCLRNGLVDIFLVLQNRPSRISRPESASSQNMVSKQKNEMEKNRKLYLA